MSFDIQSLASDSMTENKEKVEMNSLRKMHKRALSNSSSRQPRKCQKHACRSGCAKWSCITFNTTEESIINWDQSMYRAVSAPDSWFCFVLSSHHIVYKAPLYYSIELHLFTFCLNRTQLTQRIISTNHNWTKKSETRKKSQIVLPPKWTEATLDKLTSTRTTMWLGSRWWRLSYDSWDTGHTCSGLIKW